MVSKSAAEAPAADEGRAAAASDSRRFGPGWPVRSAADGPDPRTTFPGVLWARQSRSWYIGALFSMFWMLTVGAEVIANSPTLLASVVGVGLIIVFSLAFLAAAPISWTLPTRGRLALCAAMFALSFAFIPWLGWGMAGVWTYVGVIIGMCALPWRLTWMLIGLLGALALACAVAQDGGWHDDVLLMPVIVVSISLMMAAFARTMAAINTLQATQDQMAVLAAERERGRVARDIHDILGHSLTVITVKAELAGRLIDIDPARAKTEIGEVEGLARGALADVRSTVAGFRGVTVSSELAAARVALDAAGIAAELPSSTDAVSPEHRELAGWIVREGITNVVRHAAASVCRVRLGTHEVEIADDGVGPSAGSSTSTGLEGLRERVETAGGRMSVGRSDLGGFRLRVTL